MIAQIQQANGRDDFVRAALKLFEHFVGVLEAAGFSD